MLNSCVDSTYGERCSFSVCGIVMGDLCSGSVVQLWSVKAMVQINEVLRCLVMTDDIIKHLGVYLWSTP